MTDFTLDAVHDADMRTFNESNPDEVKTTVVSGRTGLVRNGHNLAKLKEKADDIKKLDD